MTNNLKKALIALMAALSVSALAACELPFGDSSSDSLSDTTSSTVPEESVEPECEHVYADEYTCHDRVCTECGEKLKATTEHTFGDWVTIRYADCENGGMDRRTCECEETEERDTEALGHTYADEITCRDRVCTVEDCGHIEPASSAHAYGDWTEVSAPTCLQDGQDLRVCADCGNENTKVTTKDHEFNAEGVCPMCEQSVKDLFITVAGVENNTDVEQVSIDKVKGTYEITTTGENDYDAYAKIPGSVLTALKELGYTQLTFTVINPAPGLCDMNDKCKSFMLAADAPANLWSASTAVAYWAWKDFWDAGKRVTFTVDLETYAGRDLYIYTQQCGTYPTVIQIAEFVDYENPLTYVSANGNCSVEYVEGKGWQFVAIDETSAGGGKYALISKDVVQYNLSQGKNIMKISFVNSFGLEGSGNEGNPVNTQMAVLPEKAAGGNDWYFCNGYISQVGTLDSETNAYYVLVNLEDTNYDFTKDVELYFKYCDVANNIVKTNYISSIEFVTHTEHTYDWAVTKETNCKEVGYETGTCSFCKATTTRALEEELKAHNHVWTVTTPANCKEQGVETGVCSVCGDTQTRATTGELLAHYYEWNVTTEGTCVTPAVETGVCTGCGDTDVRDGAYGDHSVAVWSNGEKATCLAKATEVGDCVHCGEAQVREVGELAEHSYDGINCGVCGISIAKDLIIAEEGATIAMSAAQGAWTITSTASNAYAKMDGAVLTALKENGYTKLTLTVSTNETSAIKDCYIAADARGNLWSADTAIAFYNWKSFWDAGKSFTVELDLETYAGRTIYIFTNKCDQFYTKITIQELIDYEHPEARLVASDNGAVEYIEGKGWHAYSANDKDAYYVAIPGSVVSYYINKGYTSLKLSVVNNLNIGITTAGNPVNVQQAVLLKNSAGSNDWNYCNGALSAKWTSENGGYSHTIDLTNTAYDFSRGVTLYFTMNDVYSQKVGHTYFTGIEFLK